MPPSATFRRRRLSIVSPEDDAKSVEEATEKAAPTDEKPKRRRSAKRTRKLPSHVLHAVEIEDISLADIPAFEGDDKSLRGMNTFGSSHTGRHHTTYAHPEGSTIQCERPFPSDKVGAFSAHGIEPHPYIVREAPSLFSGELQPKIVTLVTQKINQDRGCVAYPFGNDDRTALFAVFDGHGKKGELVAEFAMNEIQKQLREHSDFVTDLEKAIHESFFRVDSLIARMRHLSPYQSGTTACVVILEDDDSCVSNVGDSRAVLGRRKGKESERKPSSPSPPYEAIELSKDQNGCCPRERDRILKSGGYVSQAAEPGLPSRIWLDEACTMVGLAMSRSLGDFNLKHVGVISDPVVTHHTLIDEDEFLIIASDGVWEFIQSDEAVEIVGQCFGKGLGASEACVHLIRTAMKAWKENEGDYRDDITAVVVRLPGLWDTSTSSGGKKGS